jgi:hypothetical protein
MRTNLQMNAALQRKFGAGNAFSAFPKIKWEPVTDPIIGGSSKLGHFVYRKTAKCPQTFQNRRLFCSSFP